MEPNTCNVHNVRFYNLEPKGIHCLAYERQHRKLAVSRSDNSLEIWDVNTVPHLERSIPGAADNSIEALVWCENRLFSTGLQAVVVEYNILKLSQKAVAPVTPGPAWCLGINRKKSHLAVGTEEGYINLFDITADSLLYEKVLDKQEGRILCLAWDATGDFIVSGSIDTVRIWNVHTGHAIQRMTTGRLANNRETIVWCLAVTDDFTIISGDSRGWLCFWDGHSGVLSESYESHAAHIFCLCLSEDQNNIFCAGMDPVIANYVRVSIRGQGKRSRWVKSVQRRIHEHDVRALVLDCHGRLFSGGVDGYLALSSYPPKLLVKFPPLLQYPSVVVACSSRCILLRHRTTLEVWRLGQNTDGMISESAVRLLTLASRGGEAITAAAISSNSHWLAYSTSSALRLFTFTAQGDEVSLQRVKQLPDECGPSHQLRFSPSSEHLVVATNEGTIAVLHLEDQPCLLYVLTPISEKLFTDAVFLLDISSDGRYLVAADHDSHIVIWLFRNGKLYAKLPHYRYPATAMKIGKSNNLIAVYSDHKIIEYDLQHRSFTKFSQGLEGKHPKQWLSRNFPVTNITFDPRKPDVIILQDDSTICIIDKNKELPEIETKIPRIDSPVSDSRENSASYPQSGTPIHAFHVIKKYKHLVHVEWLEGDELVVVEINPSMLIAQLPPALAKKRFGV